MSNCHKFSSLFDDKDVIANVLCMFKIMILQYLPLYTYNIIRYNKYVHKMHWQIVWLFFSCPVNN